MTDAPIMTPTKTPPAQMVNGDRVFSSKSWIWNHAKAMNKSVSALGPSDMCISMSGGKVHISCTITNAFEAEAVREMIALVTKPMTRHREMLLADIIEREPPPTHREQLAKFLAMELTS